MRTSRFFLALLICLSCWSIVMGQDDAKSTSEADLQFQKLQRGFAALRQTLNDNKAILDEDRPAIEGFLQRVKAFSQQWPDHPGGVAMEIHLSRWLGHDEGVGDLYKRLAEMEPDNLQFSLAWLGYKASAEDADVEALFIEYERLYERFPDNEMVQTSRAAQMVRWASELRQNGRYDEAINLFEGAELDPALRPKDVLALAECLYAQHRFGEALAALESIPSSALNRDRQLNTDVDTSKRRASEAISLWQTEQEIRSEEATADDLPLVEIHTDAGRILVELFENEAPNTVANFISLAESGFYKETMFHRYVADFMIQGGDPNTLPGASGDPGHGGPDYYIKDEHDLPNRRSHFGDSLAMAKTPPPNTAGSQFYFTHHPTPWLDGQHTVFGRIVEGLDAARALRNDDAIRMMIVLRKRAHEYVPETIEKTSIQTIDIPE